MMWQRLCRNSLLLSSTRVQVYNSTHRVLQRNFATSTPSSRRESSVHLLSGLRCQNKRAMSTKLPPFDTPKTFYLSEEPNTKWDLGEGLDVVNGGTLAKQWENDEKMGWTSVDLAEMDKP